MTATDSTLATWTGSPNHSSRKGTKVDRITLHIMAGRLAGTDATFARASRKASSTYGVGSDGSIHQYVRESEAAWADGSMDSNRRTISIEHEGGLAGIPCTDACVQASARLCADIALRHGWTRLTHGANVWLHREVPPHTHPACPDKCANPLPWQTVIDKANALIAAQTTTTDKDKEEDDMPQLLIAPFGTKTIYYWDGVTLHPLAHPDEATAIKMAYKAATGKDIKTYAMGSKGAPWFLRLQAAIKRSV